MEVHQTAPLPFAPVVNTEVGSKAPEAFHKGVSGVSLSLYRQLMDQPCLAFLLVAFLVPHAAADHTDKGGGWTGTLRAL